MFGYKAQAAFFKAAHDRKTDRQGRPSAEKFEKPIVAGDRSCTTIYVDLPVREAHGTQIIRDQNIVTNEKVTSCRNLYIWRACRRGWRGFSDGAT